MNGSSTDGEEKEQEGESRSGRVADHTPPDREYHSVSVRKIENGFLITKNIERNGKYESREFFSKVRPSVNIDSKPLGPRNPVKAAAKGMEKFIDDEDEE